MTDHRSPDLFLSELCQQSFLSDWTYLETVESTNTWALENSFRSPAKLPMLVWARSQTSGRGRGVNRWHSQDGSLTFSIAVRSRHVAQNPAELPKLALLAGIAVQSAIQPIIPAEDVRVKWPNDVFVSDRKLAGILVEIPKAPATAAVIGIGLNVGNSLKGAPDDVQRRAISLGQLADEAQTVPGILRAIITSFDEHWQAFESGRWNLLQQWSPVCYLTGKRIQLQSAQKKWHGTVRGLAADGALQLETRPGVVERIYAGEVTVIA
jgi:BirA family biotin operon repressor/biotin-[acetyl-CoA-carboxylase] ligase